MGGGKVPPFSANFFLFTFWQAAFGDGGTVTRVFEPFPKAVAKKNGNQGNAEETLSATVML